MSRLSPTKTRWATRRRMRDRYVCGRDWQTDFRSEESIRFRSRSTMHPPSEPVPLRVQDAQVWEPGGPRLAVAVARRAAGRRAWHKMRLTSRQNADFRASIRLTSSLRITYWNCLLDTTSAGLPEIVRCVRSWATGSGVEIGPSPPVYPSRHASWETLPRSIAERMAHYAPTSFPDSRSASRVHRSRNGSTRRHLLHRRPDNTVMHAGIVSSGPEPLRSTWLSPR